MKEAEPKVLDVYKVSNLQNGLVWNATLNITLTITNKYFEQVKNVTFEENIPTEFDAINSTAKTLTPMIKYTEDTREINHTWNSLEIGEIVKFWTVYRVTTNESKQVTFRFTNVTFVTLDGIKGSEQSNLITVRIDILSTDTVTGLPAPKTGTIPSDPWFPIFGLILPILLFYGSFYLVRQKKK